jgi:hypothetical protein
MNKEVLSFKFNPNFTTEEMFRIRTYVEENCLFETVETAQKKLDEYTRNRDFHVSISKEGEDIDFICTKPST